MICGSIPIVILGGFLKFYKINYIYHSWIIACSAIIFSLLLFFSDKNKTTKELNDIWIDILKTFGESLNIQALSSMQEKEILR